MSVLDAIVIAVALWAAGVLIYRNKQSKSDATLAVVVVAIPLAMYLVGIPEPIYEAAMVVGAILWAAHLFRPGAWRR